MTVLRIPASNGQAIANYKKTLTNPISAYRKALVSELIDLPEGDVYAWGFPNNDRGLALAQSIETNDICFYYMSKNGHENGYFLAATILTPLSTEFSEQISMAFWDDGNFFPYILNKPIEIEISPQEFGTSLNPDQTFMMTFPRGAQRVANEVRAAPAIRQFGSFEGWAVDLINRYRVKEPEPIQSINPLDEVERYKRSYADLPETERNTIILSRIGQGAFRAGLIDYWKGCSVTGCKIEAVLKASHIKPWKDSDNRERLDKYNGLLLIPNLDSAFDRGLVTFKDDGRIIISERLDLSEREKLGINPDMTLSHVENDHKIYLEFHRQNVFVP